MTLKVLFVVDDVEYEVTGYYFPGEPGKLSGPPEECYPDEDPIIDIESIVGPDGPVSEELFASLEMDACDALCDAYYDNSHYY